MTSAPKRLLDCRPLADLEAKIIRDRPWNIYQHDYGLDRISVDVFGITKDQADHLLETALAYSDPAEGSAQDPFYSDPRWDVALEIMAGDIDWPLTIERILALGWDITGANGKALNCAYHFASQLVLAALDLVGRQPDVEPAAISAEAWGVSLAADADSFRRANRSQSRPTEGVHR